MQLRQEDRKNQVSIINYYVVCPPFLLEKNWTSSVVFELAGNWLSNRKQITIYTDKAQAQFAASQFAAREIPRQYNEKEHVLSKPILCIPLEILTLPKKDMNMFFSNNQTINLDSYTVDAIKFKNCSNTKWTILFDKLELSHPNQNTSEENQKIQLGM